MKKIKTRTKLVGAVAALTVAVALSAGTTFAWFTSNSTASVSSINASVKTSGDSNIMIAVGHGTNDVTFQTTLNSTDLSSYIDNVDFDGVTNTNATLNNAPTFNKLSEVNGSTPIYGGTASAGGDYIRVPITIRTDKKCTIALYDGSVTQYGDTASQTATAWDTIAANTYFTGDSMSGGTLLEAYAYNAVRVGFTYCSTNSVTNKEATESTGTFQVWSPNEAMYTGAETTLASGTDRTITGTTNYWKNNCARDYYNAVKGTTLSYSTMPQAGYTNYLNTYMESSDTTNSTIVETAQISESTAYYAYIYIYVWVEGTDGDCFNNILSQGISVSMDLKATSDIGS